MAVSDDFLFKTIYDRLHNRPIEDVILEYTKAKIAMLKAEEEIRSKILRCKATNIGPDLTQPVEVIERAEDLSSTIEPIVSNETNTEVEYTHDDLERNPQNAIGDNYIICCLCGAEMKSLSRHLKTHHSISPEKYRAICGYGKDIVLMSRNAALAAKERLATARESRKSSKTDAEASTPQA
jgi:predicted transcriptional regulator